MDTQPNSFMTITVNEKTQIPIPMRKIKVGSCLPHCKHLVNILDTLRYSNRHLKDKKLKLERRKGYNQLPLDHETPSYVDREEKLNQMKAEVTRLSKKNQMYTDQHLINKTMVDNINRDKIIRERQVKVLQQIKMELEARYTNTGYIFKHEKNELFTVKEALYNGRYRQKIKETKAMTVHMQKKFVDELYKKDEITGEITELVHRQRYKEDTLKRLKREIDELKHKEDSIIESFKNLKQEFSSEKVVCIIIAAVYYAQQLIRNPEREIEIETEGHAAVSANPKTYLDKNLVKSHIFESLNDYNWPGSFNPSMLDHSNTKANEIETQKKKNLEPSIISYMLKQNNDVSNKKDADFQKDALARETYLKYRYTMHRDDRITLILRNMVTSFFTDSILQCVGKLKAAVGKNDLVVRQLYLQKKERLDKLYELNSSQEKLKETNNVNKMIDGIRVQDIRYDLIPANIKTQNINRSEICSESNNSIAIRNKPLVEMQENANKLNFGSNYTNFHIKELHSLMESEILSIRAKIMRLDGRFVFMSKLSVTLYKLANKINSFMKLIAANVNISKTNQNFRAMKDKLEAVVSKTSQEHIQHKEHIIKLLENYDKGESNSSIAIFGLISRSIKNISFYHENPLIEANLHSLIIDDPFIDLDEFFWKQHESVLKDYRIDKTQMNPVEIRTMLLMSYSLNLVVSNYDNILENMTSAIKECLGYVFGFVRGKNVSLVGELSTKVSTKKTCIKPANNFLREIPKDTETRFRFGSSYTKRPLSSITHSVVLGSYKNEQSARRKNVQLNLSKFHQAKMTKPRVRTSVNEAANRSGLYTKCRAISNKMKNVEKNYRNEQVNFFRAKLKPKFKEEPCSFEPDAMLHNNIAESDAESQTLRTSKRFTINSKSKWINFGLSGDKKFNKTFF